MDASVRTDPRYAEIIEGQLYLGSIHAATDRNLLRRLGITHILNMTPKEPFLDERRFTCLRLGIEDGGEGMQELLPRSVQFIDSGERVLVHCEQGISRSATVVINYLMQRNHQTYDEALTQVRSVRPEVNPHFNFQVALLPKRRKR